MATTITIPAIFWANAPAAIQTMTFEYKLYSASTWILIDSGVQVDTDGDVLDSPVPTVTGLIENSLYYIRAYNECASPVEYFMTSVQL